MNNQEAFEKSVKHCLEQGVKSMDGVHCLYAGPNETACAIGCLLPRELSKKLDKVGPSVDYLTGVAELVGHLHTQKEAIFEARELLKGVTPSLLRELQSIHDTCRLEEWPAEFSALARVHGLEMPQQGTCNE